MLHAWASYAGHAIPIDYSPQKFQERADEIDPGWLFADLRAILSLWGLSVPREVVPDCLEGMKTEVASMVPWGGTTEAMAACARLAAS